MGTSHSFAELTRKLERLAVDMSDMQNAAVPDAAEVAKRVIKANAPARLRGVGKSGAPLDVGINLGAYEDGKKALVFAKGPWQLIERDVKPHLIVPSGATGLGAGRTARHRTAAALLESRSSRGAASLGLRGLRIGFGHGVVLHFADHFAAYVHHPGTHGKHLWVRGVALARPLVERVFESKADFVLKRLF